MSIAYHRPPLNRATKRSLLAPLLLTALLTGGVARAALAISLLESYKSALDNDPSFQGARSAQLAGMESSVIGLSSLLPSISASYGYTQNDGNRTTLSTQVTEPLRYDSKVLNLSLRQPLYSPDGWQRYQGSQAQAAYSDAQFAGARQDLIVRLTTAYLEALLAEDQLRLAIAQRDAYKENYTANQRMFEKGAGTRTDMLETRARYQIAEAQAIEMENLVDNKRQELAVIIGRDPGVLDPLARKLPELPLEHRSLEAWESVTRENNPDIQAQRHSVAYSQTEVERNRAGHYPRVDLIASYGRNTSDSLINKDYQINVTSVGVQLSIPLYSGGSVSAQTRQASARLMSDKASLDATLHKSLVEVRKQFQLVSSSLMRMQAMEEAERSAAEAVEANRKSVAGGTRVNLDVLNSLQQLFTTRRDLSDARHGYLLSHLRLRAAAGVLSDTDLVSVGACFQLTPGS